MTDKTYDIGDLVRVSGAFTNNAGAAMDPTIVTVKIKHEADDASTYVYGTNPEVIKDSVGNYHVDVNANAKGTWFYRWAGSGTVGQSAGEGLFVVKESHF